MIVKIRNLLLIGALLSSAPAVLGANSTVSANAVSAVVAHTDMILLTVDKSALKAELRTWPEDATGSGVLHSFKIAIGKVLGDKEKEGDNKTPEGIYFTQKVIAGSELPAKYGPKAIPLNFPNPIDRMDGKTGHGIWLHGADNEQRIEASNVTEGCVAFYNADIERLTDWLKPYQGIVVIANDASTINRVEDIKAVKEAANAWVRAWAERQLDDYIGYYGPSFRFDGGDVKSYRDYKGRVFKSYKSMSLKMTDLRVVTHPKYALTIMNQDFHGDHRFASIGRKILYWHKNAGGPWQISREVYEDRRVEPVQYTDAELAALMPNSTAPARTAEKTSNPNL